VIVVAVVVVIVVVVIILLDDNVRLGVFDNDLGLFVVVADVEYMLERSAGAGQASKWLTLLRLRLRVSPSFARTSAAIGGTSSLADISAARTGRVPMVASASTSTSASLSLGLRETMTVLG